MSRARLKFRLKTVSLDKWRWVRSIVVDGKIVGTVTRREDYVCAKPTDTIRTKWASINDITWADRNISSNYDLRDYELRHWIGIYLEQQNRKASE